ncbi:hypothetical protein F5882DRAFT_466342 [Hyaloscypha sp. PMI_1271]|nr:hypothetical protein F5882DRAFT_466342 [Hyaloscypha sp. PMI_1271]
MQTLVENFLAFIFPQNCITSAATFRQLKMVSSDAAISIAFGLISTLIGLVGAIINYLTLRAMTLEIGTTSQLYPQPSPSLTLSLLNPQSPFYFSTKLMNPYAENNNNRIPPVREQVLRHEHTFIDPFVPPRR